MTDADRVDVVAQAIRDVFVRREGKRVREWAALPDKVREEFRLEAIAAIAAYERCNRM